MNSQATSGSGTSLLHFIFNHCKTYIEANQATPTLPSFYWYGKIPQNPHQSIEWLNPLLTLSIILQVVKSTCTSWETFEKPRLDTNLSGSGSSPTSTLQVNHLLCDILMNILLASYNPCFPCSGACNAFPSFGTILRVA